MANYRADEATIAGTAIASVIAVSAAEGRWELFESITGLVLAVILAVYYRTSGRQGWWKDFASSAVIGLVACLSLAYPVEQALVYKNSSTLSHCYVTAQKASLRVEEASERVRAAETEKDFTKSAQLKDWRAEDQINEQKCLQERSDLYLSLLFAAGTAAALIARRQIAKNRRGTVGEADEGVEVESPPGDQEPELVIERAPKSAPST